MCSEQTEGYLKQEIKEKKVLLLHLQYINKSYQPPEAHHLSLNIVPGFFAHNHVDTNL